MACLLLNVGIPLATFAVQPVASLTWSKPAHPFHEDEPEQPRGAVNASLDDDDVRLGPRFTPLPGDLMAENERLWERVLKSQREWVKTLPVRAAADTDRVAVTFLQPATSPKIELMAHIARFNMHMLGPTWALQIFYCREEEKDRLDSLLGRPENVVWAPVTLNGARVPTMTYVQFSWFMLSMDFWSKVPERFDHLLIFGDDSIVLRGPGCAEQFLDYDYVGGPWAPSIGALPQYGGNGGFRLCRRNSSIAAVQSQVAERYKAKDPSEQRFHEDRAFVEIIHAMGGTFPSRELASSFSVESVFHESPCGIHKPWRYLQPDDLRTLLKPALAAPPAAAAPAA